MKLFRKLESDKKYIGWKDDFETAAHGTGLGNLLEESYVPSSDEREDFEARNNWFFTILWEKCQTPSARFILDNYKETQDGQAAYAEIKRDYELSTTADLYTDELFELITQSKFNPRQGTSAMAFISDLEKTMNEYNRLVRDTSQRISEASRRVFVNNALEGVAEFRAIKSRERDRIAMYGDSARLNYIQYLGLVRETAKSYDRTQALRSRRNNNASQMYAGYHDSGQNEREDDRFEVQYQAHMSSAGETARVDTDLWNTMSPEDKQHWIKINPEIRSKIRASSSGEHGGGGGQQRKVNFAATQEMDSNEDHDATEDNDNGEQGEDTTQVEANRSLQETNQVKGKAHPADIRRVLGGAPSKKPPSTPKGSVTKSAARSSANHTGWIVNSIRQSNRSEGNAGVSTPSETEEVDVDAFEENRRVTAQANTTLGWSDDNLEDLYGEDTDYWGEQDDQVFR